VTGWWISIYMKMAVFWVVMLCSLVEVYRFSLMMDAARTFEILVNFYQTTQHYNPEDSHLHTHHHENLRSKYLYFTVCLKNFPPLFQIFLWCYVTSCNCSHEFPRTTDGYSECLGTTDCFACCCYVSVIWFMLQHY
jgi:hypothetical protein